MGKSLFMGKIYVLRKASPTRRNKVGILDHEKVYVKRQSNFVCVDELKSEILSDLFIIFLAFHY